MVQLLESGDPTLENHIRSSPHLLPLAHKLATTTTLSSGQSASEKSVQEGGGGDNEDAGSEVDGMGDGGEREIVELARTVLELLDVEHKE
jgi:vacuolar protein 8